MAKTTWSSSYEKNCIEISNTKLTPAKTQVIFCKLVIAEIYSHEQWRTEHQLLKPAIVSDVPLEKANTFFLQSYKGIWPTYWPRTMINTPRVLSYQTPTANSNAYE